MPQIRYLTWFERIRRQIACYPAFVQIGVVVIRHKTVKYAMLLSLSICSTCVKISCWWPICETNGIEEYSGMQIIFMIFAYSQISRVYVYSQMKEIRRTRFFAMVRQKPHCYGQFSTTSPPQLVMSRCNCTHVRASQWSPFNSLRGLHIHGIPGYFALALKVWIC